MKPKELKKIIVAEGFQVFRTQVAELVLAERVRENLILDSGVSVLVDEPFVVRFIARAQARDYRGETEAQLFDRASRQGAAGTDAGYVEASREVVKVDDPGDSSKILDTWYQVSFEKKVSELSQLFEELRYSLQLQKLA